VGDGVLQSAHGDLDIGDSMKLTVKRSFSIIPGSVRKWTENLGRHALAVRDDPEMCTPMCARVIDVLACGKLKALSDEMPVTIYSVPSHDIDTNIDALKEAIAYLEWLKIGENC